MPNPYLWSTDPGSNDLIDGDCPFPEGMPPPQVNNSARAVMAAIAMMRLDQAGDLTAHLSGSTYSLPLHGPDPDPGKPFWFACFLDAPSPGPVALQIGNIAPKPLLRPANWDCAPQTLVSGELYYIHWLPSLGCYRLLAPDVGSPGVIRMQGGTDYSRGWVPCDGRTLSRTSYSALFLAIGTAFGAGDGSTTFAVPDLRGRAPFGVDYTGTRLTGAGGVGGSLGNAGGAETATIDINHMPSHSHGVEMAPAGALAGGTTGNAGGHDHGGTTGTTGSHTHTGTTDGGGSHTHSGTTDNQGNHTHPVQFKQQAVYALGQSGAAVTDIGADRSPNTFDNTDAAGSHTHNLNIGGVGNHTHTITTDAAGAHAHTIAAVGDHSHSYPGVPNHTHATTIDATGGGQALPLMPPALIVNFAIRA